MRHAFRSTLLVFVACGPVASSGTGGGTSAGSEGTSGASTAGESGMMTGVPTGDGIVGMTSTWGTLSTSGPSSTSGDSGESSLGFIQEIDVPAPECDVFAQDCSPGSKCSFFSENAAFGDPIETCVPVAEDPRQPGELCHFNEPGIGLDDCALGSYCLPFNSDGAGASV